MEWKSDRLCSRSSPSSRFQTFQPFLSSFSWFTLTSNLTHQFLQDHFSLPALETQSLEGPSKLAPGSLPAGG